MTLAALAASSALTSITAAKPAPAAPANGAPAPAFNKLLDRARTSDDGAAKDETALPKGAKTDDTDSDADTETKSDNVVTLKTETTPTPSPDALTAAAGEGVTAVLALIQMANAAMTPPPAATPVVTTTDATPTPTIAAPTIAAPIVNTTPVALTNVPAALQQVLAQASTTTTDKATPAIASDQPTADLPDVPVDVDLPETTATVVTLPTGTKPLDTATILAALKARAAVIDAEAAPQQPVIAAKVATADPMVTATTATTTMTPPQTAPIVVQPAAPVPLAGQAAQVEIQPAVAPVTAAMATPVAQADASDTISTPITTASTPAPSPVATAPVVAEQAPVVTAPTVVEQAPVAAPVQIAAAPVAPAPAAVAPAAPQPAPPRVDDRTEPVKTEAPRAESTRESTESVTDTAQPADPLPTPMAAAPERAPRAEGTTQAAPAAPADNQPVQRHLDLARDTQWLDQLTRDINMAAATNGHLKFQLNPERLGALTVEIANSASGASIKFTADSVDAQKIIADAQPRLVAEARQQGLTIAETKVDLSNNRQPGSGASTMNGQGQNPSGQQSSQDAKHSVRSTSTMREEPAESATRDDDDRYA